MRREEFSVWRCWTRDLSCLFSSSCDCFTLLFISIKLASTLTPKALACLKILDTSVPHLEDKFFRCECGEKSGIRLFCMGDSITSFLSFTAVLILNKFLVRPLPFFKSLTRFMLPDWFSKGLVKGLQSENYEWRLQGFFFFGPVWCFTCRFFGLALVACLGKVSSIVGYSYCDSYLERENSDS